MKRFLSRALTTHGLCPQAKRLKRCAPVVALACLTGCIATENRWQAGQMRQQVMDYYNDQIMENLIRTTKHLAFVHLDITTLTTTDGATLAGSVGGGETRNFNRTSPPALAALHTISRGVTRPFTWSVSPQRTTSLQIVASPALGTLPATGQTSSKTTTTSVTTEPVKPPDETQKSVKTTTTKEETSTPSQLKTVYDTYDWFLKTYPHALASNGSIPPNTGYVPGTIKRWGKPFSPEYFYIVDDDNDRKGYEILCKTLFSKGSGQSIEGAVRAQANAAVEATSIR